MTVSEQDTNAEDPRVLAAVQALQGEQRVSQWELARQRVAA